MRSWRVEVYYLGVFLLSFLIFMGASEALGLEYRVNILLAFLSIVVFVSVFLLRCFGKYQWIGFFFLGTVLFKMFGVGYCALFEPDFKRGLIKYFLVLWYYLLLETLYIVACIRTYDKYHIK